MPNETLPTGALRDADTATGDTTVPNRAPSVRERVPQCPPELADLLDALLGPAGARPTREESVAVLARLFPPPEPNKMRLTPEGQARLAELKWIDDVQLTGAWDHYAGNYLGVHDKRVIAFGPDLIELRAGVEREHGISPAALAVCYIHRPDFE